MEEENEFSFPAKALSELDLTIKSTEWTVSCLREGNLATCLYKATHILKSNVINLSQIDQLFKKFITKVLPSTLTKLLNSGAVLDWEAKTFEGVHNMLELIVIMVSEFLTLYLKYHNQNPDAFVNSSKESESPLYWLGKFCSILKIVFDPDVSFHFKCKDKNTNPKLFS
ncbi:hypothetical protein Ciccas_005372 [Cichlidogyrus casuarinus]|uniref:Uncharacterized protein n=1 Tax=Cichlidogyrus casuarinus TaxID=1844966 RepID=A0ABD2Q8U9_9PLAT